MCASSVKCVSGWDVATGLYILLMKRMGRPVAPAICRHGLARYGVDAVSTRSLLENVFSTCGHRICLSFLEAKCVIPLFIGKKRIPGHKRPHGGEWMLVRIIVSQKLYLGFKVFLTKISHFTLYNVHIVSFYTVITQDVLLRQWFDKTVSSLYRTHVWCVTFYAYYHVITRARGMCMHLELLKFTVNKRKGRLAWHSNSVKLMPVQIK